MPDLCDILIKKKYGEYFFSIFFDFLSMKAYRPYPEIHLKLFFHLVCKQKEKIILAPGFIICSDLCYRKYMHNCAYLMR